MPMYNLLEYSKNYRKTIGSLYNYYRDELIGNTYNVDAAAAGLMMQIKMVHKK